jgi:Phage integrase family
VAALYPRTGAVKVTGSPFKTFADAETACSDMLGILGASRAAQANKAAPLSVNLQASAGHQPAPFTTAGFCPACGACWRGCWPWASRLMLRHACGFALANKGHDTRALQAYLGHKNIHHTVRYTELAPQRFKDFWR